MKNKTNMKKFIIIERIPSIQSYLYEVEAETADEALDMVKNGEVESEEYLVEPNDDDNPSYEIQDNNII